MLWRASGLLVGKGHLFSLFMDVYFFMMGLGLAGSLMVKMGSGVDNSVVAFSSRARILGECSTINSPPALFLLRF